MGILNNVMMLSVQSNGVLGIGCVEDAIITTLHHGRLVIGRLFNVQPIGDHFVHVKWLYLCLPFHDNFTDVISGAVGKGIQCLKYYQLLEAQTFAAHLYMLIGHECS